MSRDYLTVADVLGMHTLLMQRYGGAAGVRDPGALEAALFRPQTGYYEDIVAEAAALMESLAINHPFVDGNKRVALLATVVFLRLNGVRLAAKNPEVVRFIVEEVIVAKADVPAIAKWLEKWMVVSE